MNLTSMNYGIQGKRAGVKGVPDIARICSLCGVDRTPLPGGIEMVNDRRGKCLGLFGQCCYRAVMDAVDESPRAYHWSDNYSSDEKSRETILVRAKELLKKI